MLVASVAHADNMTFHGTANGSIATTDNENGTAENKKGAIFSDLRPGFLLTYNSPRHIHELISEVQFLYTLFADRPSVTFRGEYKAFLLTGPRSEMSLDAGASSGQVNALRAGDSPVETPTMVLPAGRTDVTQVSAAENASWQATRASRIFERVFSRYGTTDDKTPMVEVDTKSFEIGAAVGFDRRLESHNFVFELGGSFVHLDKYDPMMVQMGSRIDNQLNPRGVAVWQYDITRKWSSNLDAGVVYVHPVTELFGRDLRDPYNPDDERMSAWFPVFGGVLAYSDVWGRAQLSARRSVTPNLFIAQNTVADGVNLTFAMPLTFLDKDARKRQPKVVGIGTAGFERTDLIDPVTSEREGRFNVARVDFALGWSPRPGQTLGLRYEVTYQNGDTVGEMVVPSYLRNTFYFTFALRYPEDVQVRVPRRKHQSVRADGGDLAPIGAEPVVIDPAELLEPGGR